MAHVKAGSTTASQGANVKGKRRGLKVNQGELVNGGQILVRQTGVVYKPGENAKLSKDHSVISLIKGYVRFSYYRRPNSLKTVVNVDPEGTKVVKESVKSAEKVEKTVSEKVEVKKPVVKKEVKKVVAKAKTVKKVVKKVAQKAKTVSKKPVKKATKKS